MDDLFEIFQRYKSAAQDLQVKNQFYRFVEHFFEHPLCRSNRKAAFFLIIY
jgi:hypothetical protein